VPFRLESIEEADTEFLALPPGVREVFIAAFREIAASATPLARGPEWYSEELRQRQRIAVEGLFSLHVRSLWRGVYFRRGDSLVFIAFGFRLPEFYDKLKRLRKSVSNPAPSRRD
jgi:phage-related protein